jgi:hypothetical protein
MGGKHDGRVPNYTDHSFMPLCLSIVNQFNDVHESKFEIPVERIPTQIRPRAERRCTLYVGAEWFTGTSSVTSGRSPRRPAHQTAAGAAGGPRPGSLDASRGT